MNKNATTKGNLFVFAFAGIAMTLACLPVRAADIAQPKINAQPKVVAHPAKVKVETHYLVPVKSGPNAARPGHPGKPFEMTEIKTTTRPAVVKKTHRRVARRDRYSYMRETILQAARKQ